jgi:hypothetical protein
VPTSPHGIVAHRAGVVTDGRTEMIVKKRH